MLPLRLTGDAASTPGMIRPGARTRASAATCRTVLVPLARPGRPLRLISAGGIGVEHVRGHLAAPADRSPAWSPGCTTPAPTRSAPQAGIIRGSPPCTTTSGAGGRAALSPPPACSAMVRNPTARAGTSRLRPVP